MSSTPPYHQGGIFFSGYHPIEVTHEDFRRTVTTTKSEDEDELQSDKGGKRSCLPHKSMTKRIGNMWLTPRKMKTLTFGGFAQHERDDQGIQGEHQHNLNHGNDGSSTSGISNQGQQSVANKTVDSQTTIKVSNRHEGVVLDGSSSPSQTRKQSKPWKTLKRLVKGASSSLAMATTSTDPDKSFHSAHNGNRKHAKSCDGIAGTEGLAAFRGFSSSSLLNNAYPLRKRIQSEDPTASGGKKQPNSQRNKQGNASFPGVTGPFSASSSVEPQLNIDRAIRGRLDGLDVLSLGPASRSSLPNRTDKISSFLKNISDHSNTNSNTTHLGPLEDPLRVSFTDLPSKLATADLVSDMICASGGKEQTELIFEGFVPGGGDRWSVKISTEEQLSSASTNDSYSHHSSHSPPGLQSTTDDDESSTAISSLEDGSTNLPTNLLWHNLWGSVGTPPPIPSHMQTTTRPSFSKHGSKFGGTSGSRQQYNNGVAHPDDEDSFEDFLHSSASEEQMQTFAATCNVPIDLDDDAFIIDSPDHLRSVHELIMVPLQSRRFDTAISLLEKLLRGLEGQQKFQHLVGGTHHNMGIIHLCQGRYGDALIAFQRAVNARRECLPDQHPDIAVSLMQLGMAYFALESIDDALRCFETALTMCTAEDATRAKILNNIGVAWYQVEDYAKALKSFTKALEIQRPWLDGPVRREAIAYDASITLANMGKVYLCKGDYDLAYFVFEEACLIQTSSFRKDHDIVLTSLDNMARVHAKNGNQAEALRIFTGLLRSQQARFGSESEICIETIGMKGLTHFKLLEFEESLQCMKRVSAWQIKHMGRSHPSIHATMQKIMQIQRCLQGEEPVWV